jgi:acrosin
MFHKLFPLLAISIWGVVVLPLSELASATIPLTRAEIQDLRNLVQLIPRNSPKKRPARKSDAMIPGDGLSTGRASLADLRFNDGSLARVGEQAVFQFLPRTRNFSLKNGTVLLLIPPGRGQTRIQTPNAAAAIRGSALFVRYDETTETTIVGALTDSGIEVSNKQASQSQVLEAGQLMVIVKGKFQGLYDFDLRNFYETSDLVRGLDLTRQNLAPTPDPAIASVQAETAAAVATQTPIKGEGVLENPSFLQLTATSSNSQNNENSNAINEDNEENSSLNPVQENLSVDSFVDTGQVQLNEQLDNGETSTTPQIPSSTPSEAVTPPKPDVVPPKLDVVPPKPDVVPPKPDVVPPKPDVVPPKPDVVPPKPDVEPPKPDVIPPKPDVVPPKPDVVPPKPDVVPPKPDVIPPKPDVEPPKPDVIPPKPDVEPPKPDVIPPKPDVEPPKPDVIPPKPDVEPPKPDVEPPPRPTS